MCLPVGFLLVVLCTQSDGRYLPNFEKVAQNVTVTKGQNALLTCHVTHLGGYKVGWIKLDSKAIQAIHTHVITHNSRVSVQHFAPSMWQLNISNVQAEDQGPYMCQLNTDPMRNQVVYLRVLVPPEIELMDNRHEIIIPEGSSIKLGCRAKGDPHPVVRWHREDGEDICIRAPNGERLRFAEHKGETLKLDKISRLDMGIYICTANNGVPSMTSRRIHVKVNFNPVIHVPSQLIWSHVGESTTMECYVEASPRSINYWIKGDGGHISKNGSKYSESEIRESFNVKMVLTIHSFHQSDVGKYRCVAKNSLGEVEGRIHVYESQARPAKTATKTYENDDVIYEDEEYVTEVEVDKANLLEAQDAHQKQLSTESSWRQPSNKRSQGQRQCDISSSSWLFAASALVLVAHVNMSSR